MCSDVDDSCLAVSNCSASSIWMLLADLPSAFAKISFASSTVFFFSLSPIPLRYKRPTLVEICEIQEIMSECIKSSEREYDTSRDRSRDKRNTTIQATYNL